MGSGVWGQRSCALDSLGDNERASRVAAAVRAMRKEAPAKAQPHYTATLDSITRMREQLGSQPLPPAQEQNRAQRLILSHGRHPLAHRQVSQVIAHHLRLHARISGASAAAPAPPTDSSSLARPRPCCPAADASPFASPRTRRSAPVPRKTLALDPSGARPRPGATGTAAPSARMHRRGAPRFGVNPG